LPVLFALPRKSGAKKTAPMKFGGKMIHTKLFAFTVIT